MTAENPSAEDVSAILRNLVKQLDNLLTRLQKQSADKVSLSEILRFSERLVNSFAQMRAPMLSLLLHPQAFRAIVSSQHTTTALQQLIWISALCHANQYNKSCQQQLIAASITSNVNANNPAFAKHLPILLSKSQQNLWLAAYQQLQQSAKYQFRLLQNNAIPEHRYLVALAVMLLGLTQQYSYVTALQKLITALCPAAQLLLHPLIGRYGCALPGMILESGLYVLDIQLPKALVCDYSDRAIKSPYWLDCEKLLNAKTIPDLSANMLSEYWQLQQANKVEESTEFRIDKPPRSLLEIQRLMQNDQAEVDEIANAIQTEPLFAEHIQHTASDASRLQLPITDNKHALMLQGLEKSRFILLRQALMLRLNQRYFPLQNNFVQFTQLRCQLAAQLCELSLDINMVEEIRTLALFASGGLFTLAQLKPLLDWKMREGSAHLLHNLFDHPQANQLQEHSIKLAKAWQQSSSSLLALQQQHLSPDELRGNHRAKVTTCILGLSLILARQAFFQQTDKVKGDKYLLQALNMLQINPQDTTEICDQALVFSRCYCPWHLGRKFAINRAQT